MINLRTVIRTAENSYRAFLQSPTFLGETDRPLSFEDMPEGLQEKLRKTILSAILQEFKKKDERIIDIDYEPYPDAVASKIVGKMSVRFPFVIKVGGKELAGQIRYINNLKSHYRHLFPNILAFESIDDQNFVCFMEELTDYESLHKILFLRLLTDERKLLDIFEKAIRILGEIYVSERIDSHCDVNVLYIQNRLIDRIKAAEAKFTSSGQTSKGIPFDIPNLINKRIILDGKELLPYEKCLPIAQKKLLRMKPICNTLIHGDPHPGNVLTRPEESVGSSIRFIDPNPKIVFGDFIYDIGKIWHWLEWMGLFILERSIKEELVKIDVEEYDNTLKVIFVPKEEVMTKEGHRILPKILQQTNAEIFDIVWKYAKDVATYMKDDLWNIRLPLSIAASYIGGMVYFNEPTQLMACFVNSLKWMNSLINSENTVAPEKLISFKEPYYNFNFLQF
jgi:hypothetical protein